MHGFYIANIALIVVISIALVTYTTFVAKGTFAYFVGLMAILVTMSWSMGYVTDVQVAHDSAKEQEAVAEVYAPGTGPVNPPNGPRYPF
ncbi:MAG: hypothetical protein A2408_01590 [Candidatus Yonathbacteria bacterium RIFOXYC1_FULL_52_10]|uniref:Uncharacterized protein n=1 Tax=Candidatus Yonathbacteria bacterium RIFOXYD1_FULL_52_36 TaxID=1802730 RepID=A0A1G2SL09_9BACT|nr:MAG: hypothetical protein A2408_01590 [Candidatus Yonathbacteria bacterium RIFOXYC1_FULL_52_10]OHA85763.1 MAG: hypothetical protein A2591_02760 [Candidatus Yonathbacteria bacterium RIFOXYD1_FULL_52_36]